MPTTIAGMIARVGLVRTILGLAMINIMWAISSNILLHFYLPPGTFAGGWRVEVAVSTVVALLVTIPADIILIMLARSITQQRDALRQLAHQDHLTGLSNRRAFDEQVTRLVDVAGVTGVLILIDVDHFKQVNDRFGHDAGDQVLQQLGATLMAGVRSHDVLGRLGGEEFGLFLPHTGVDGAYIVAERLRKQVQATVISCEDFDISVTISLGIVATMQCTGGKMLYRSADAALYSAKHRGRNQVAMFDVESTPLPRDTTPRGQGKTVSLSLLGEIS